MGAPRNTVNSLTKSVGFDSRLVTVLQIAGNTAVCADRQGNEVRVPMYIQRTKGQLPSVGDNWLISQDFGQWAFQAFIGQQPGDFVGEELTNGAVLSPVAPSAPSPGDIWINSLTGVWSVWDGTQWNVTSAAGGAVISDTPPPDPTVGMIWVDSSNGNLVNIWDGVQWDAAPVGSNAIVAGAIVAGLIAAGAIDGQVINGAIINGGQITGSDFITSGTTGAYFIYTSGGNIVQTFKTQGSSTWTCPAGVTSGLAESWGAGGGGGGGFSGTGGGGGGGGEYAAQSLAVTPLVVYDLTVGVPGSGGSTGGTGGDSLFTGDAATSQGHGGHGGTQTAAGSGGSGSSDATHLSGGQGSPPVVGNQVSQVFSASGTHSWVAPSGVTSVQAECWGAGGGGQAGFESGTSQGGLGGAGGAYARVNSFPVIPGHSYSLTVGTPGQGGPVNGQQGTNGGSTTFNSGTCVAAGGKASTGSPAQGGQASASTGNVTFSGGNGGNATGNGGSGGGSSAGSSASGNNGQSVTGSLGGSGGPAPVGGGGGGKGTSSGSGNPGHDGFAPGGGGGGGGGGIAVGGGDGAAGQVTLTYTVSSGGGGGGSGGTAQAGKSATTSGGASAVTGGGPGGDGSVSANGASPGVGPGGGGGGGGIGHNGGAGSAGQVRLTYVSATPVLSGSIAGAAGNDPFAGTPYPEGAQFDNLYIQVAARIGGSIWLAPSQDGTGTDDTSAISGAYSTYSRVNLLPGTWFTKNNINVPANASLEGSGQGVTTVQPGSSWSGSTMFTHSGAFSNIRRMRIYGGSGTRSSNPAANAITVPNTVTPWVAEDIYFDHCNGLCLAVSPITGSHGTVRALKGEHNGGGIQVNGGTGSSVTTEINITDIDLQNCEVNEVLYLSSVTDVLCSVLNGSISGSNAVNGVTIQGSCQTCWLKGFDVGGGSGTAVLVIGQGTGSSSPSEIDVEGSVFQSGGIGIQVSDSSSRLRFRGVMSKRNQGTGWNFTGTGSAILVDGCAGNTNNQGAFGTAADVFVTSTAHVGLLGFAYCSTATSNSLIVPGTNHVTNSDPTSPGGQPVSGTPAGW